VTLFHHRSGIEGEFITHFHAGHGDHAAGLAWDLRDDRPREVMVFRSAQDFVEEGVDPTTDDRQTLIYRGSDRHVKLTDENLTNDVAYYYSVFAAADDGAWHLQLTDTVAPSSSSHWHRGGYEVDDDSRQRLIDMDIDGMAL